MILGFSACLRHYLFKCDYLVRNLGVQLMPIFCPLTLMSLEFVLSPVLESDFSKLHA